ncbi:MAG: TetR/AcrR family transcriptional regulator [Dermatophilaceae bacterium]
MATSGARRSAGQSNARSGTTRQALVDSAIDALRDVGFAGASARAIANRAGSTQSQVFYHFGSVVDLLLAALDEVSARRMKVYEPLLESATSPNELLQTARTVIVSDLDSGDLKVLVEMVAGAQTVPGLAAQVAQRLAPWYAFAEAAVKKASAGWPLPSLLPVGDIAHAVVASVLGLELLASLDADHTRATALLDHAAGIALLLSATPTPPRHP